MSESFAVVVQSPGQSPWVKRFSQPRVVIGREVGDLVLADPRCSSTHAEFLYDGRVVRLRDLGSTNGTWLGDRRVQELVWTPGTSVRIGTHTLTIEAQAAQTGRGRTLLHDAVAPPERPAAPRVAPPDDPRAPDSGPARGAPKRIGLWVALGAAVAALGVGGAMVLREGGVKAPSLGASERPTLSNAGEANVQFVWVRSASEPGGKASGGTSKAKIRVGPNPSGTVSVGVSEEFVQGGGEQWRSATWMAAFNAARAVHASLADYEFNVHVGGHVDGPSAGMLTTATMLALLRDTPPRPDTTMTGTINPDGTAGPVGGIVQKMEGAKEAGLKRFGFPIGARNHYDLNAKEFVDLGATGQRLGLEVKEISDLYEAYEFLTGSVLPRPTPVSDAEMEIDDRTQALLRAKLKKWSARIDRELGGLRQELARAGNVRNTIVPLVDPARQQYEKSRRHEANGYLNAALNGYLQSAATIGMVARLTGPLTVIAEGNVADLQRAIDSAATVTREADAYAQELAVRAQTTSRGVQIATTWSYSYCVTSEAAARIAHWYAQNVMSTLQRVVSGRLRMTPEVYQQLSGLIIQSLTYYELARVALEIGRDLQDIISDEGRQPALSSESMDRIVAGYASGSAAVFGYFNSLITKRLTEDGMSEASAEATISGQEPAYQFARHLSQLSEYWKEQVRLAGERGSGQGGQGERLRLLAAATESYLVGSQLVNKYYSLGAPIRAKGTLELQYRRALTAQLEIARRTARESAARAKQEAGFIPVAARLSYQEGDADREGTDEEKLSALSSYWSATYWSELAAAK